MATGNNGMGYTQVLSKAISHVTATPVANIGDRCLWAGDEYVYVYAKTTCPVGSGCVLSDSTSYSVTISTVTDTDMGFVGVVKHVAIPSGEYGWICQHGFVSVLAGANTSLSLDNQLIMANTDSSGGANMSRITDSTIYSNLVYQPQVVGVVLLSGTTEASAACYLY